MLLIGCRTEKIEYIYTLEWRCKNESSYNLEYSGVFSSQLSKDKTFSITPNATYSFEIRSRGTKNSNPEEVRFPFEYSNNIESSVTINGTKTIPLKPNVGIRDRSKYVIDTPKNNHYIFTYTITNAEIEELLGSI